MNRFYASLLVLAAWVAAGFPVAGWLYRVLDGPTAFWVDTFGLVLPFFLISLFVIRHRRLAPLVVAVPVIVVIAALYVISAQNLWNAWGRHFG